jgi:hypothetical protein
VRGDNLVPIEFEITIELPEKYLRRDEVPAQESGPTTTGFRGDELLEPSSAPPAGRPGGPLPPTPEQLDTARRARTLAVKQDFARLMLGLFAASFGADPLTFTYAGQAEAPQGMADVLDVTSAANLGMRLFVHRESHLPVMVTWQGPTGGSGRGPGPGPTRGAGAVALPSPPQGARSDSASVGVPPENRLYFADYRDVDGLKWPFRLRRAVGSDTVEETTFDRFRINTKIDPKKFDVRR